MPSNKFSCHNCKSEVKPTDTICPNCGKDLREVGRDIEQSLIDTMSLHFSFDAVLVRGPIRYLNDTLSQNRLLEGTIVSVMFFERYGAEKLKEYFTSKGVPIEPLNIDKMKVSSIMRLLQGFSIIDCGTHGKICEVIKERNDIVHELDYPDSIDEQKLRNIIQKAIECLKTLGAK